MTIKRIQKLCFYYDPLKKLLCYLLSLLIQKKDKTGKDNGITVWNKKLNVRPPTNTTPNVACESLIRIVIFILFCFYSAHFISVAK